VEGFSKNTRTQLTGRTLCNKIVNIDAMHSMVGHLVLANVEKAYKHCLVGSVCKFGKVERTTKKRS